MRELVYSLGAPPHSASVRYFFLAASRNSGRGQGGQCPSSRRRPSPFGGEGTRGSRRVLPASRHLGWWYATLSRFLMHLADDGEGQVCRSSDTI